MSRRQGSLLARLVEAERRAAVAEYEAEAYQNQVAALVRLVQRMNDPDFEADDPQGYEVILLRRDDHG